MKRLLNLICLWLFLLSGQVMAQLPHLRVSALNNWPDTVYNNQNVGVSAVVENIGTAAYQGPLQIILQTDSGTFSYLYFNQSTSVLILPGDTIVFSPPNGYIFDSTVFRPGNNVVVVWPHSAQAIQVDTFLVTTYFIQSLFQGINDPKPIPGLKLFPNPAHHEAVITSPEIGLEGVRILNSMGKEVWSLRGENMYSIALPVQQLPVGLYMIEIIGNEGRRSGYRLLRQ
ncbi:MAG: T9SS type A sorting domain-containing protein [Bacteroidetes bacterium]|nr:T9SS type A sorting domain-containing protein [Bacteroidota bacterium]